MDRGRPVANGVERRFLSEGERDAAPFDGWDGRARGPYEPDGAPFVG